MHINDISLLRLVTQNLFVLQTCILLQKKALGTMQKSEFFNMEFWVFKSGDIYRKNDGPV